MRTKASLHGHPIHPMLVVFPLGLCISGLAALIGYAAGAPPFWFHVAYLAMIVGGFAGAGAAVFGLIDLLGLPRDSRAKAVGFYHAGAAVLSVALFLGAGFSMRAAWVDEPARAGFGLGLPIVLAVAGFIVILTAGILGWQLVGAHHVGVSPVLGHAGRVDLAETLPRPAPRAAGTPTTGTATVTTSAGARA